jgi:hypothetical protein
MAKGKRSSTESAVLAEPQLPEPFSRAVCQRLRKLAVLMNDAETKRQRAFKNRDEIQTEIDECAKSEKEKLQRLKADHFDECNEIKRLDSILKASKGKILETIETADQSEFEFQVDPNPTVASLFDKKEEEEEAGEGEDEPTD